MYQALRMNMRMLNRQLFLYAVLTILVAPVWLSACSSEPTYRGVPNTAWQQLSAEQRQLIVDQAYQEDFHKPSKQ